MQEEQQSIQALREQAKELLRSRQPRQAINTLERALELAEERGELAATASITCQLARVQHTHLRDSQGALNALTRVLARAGTADGRRQIAAGGGAWAVARAHILWATCALEVASIDTAKIFDVLDAADAFVEEVGQPQWREANMSLRAELYFQRGRYEDAARVLRESIELYDAYGGPTPGDARQTRVRVLVRNLKALGRYEEAIRWAREALANPDLHEHDRAGMYNQLGHLILESGGEPEEALRLAERGVEVAEQLGDQALTVLLGLLTEAARACGELSRAREAAARHLRLAEKLGDPRSLFAAHYDRAQVAMDDGQPDAAAEHVAVARRCAQVLDARTDHTFYMDNLAPVIERYDELTGRATYDPG